MKINDTTFKTIVEQGKAFTKSRLKKPSRGGRKRYKSDDSYLKAVYDKNKEKIDDIFGDKTANGNIKKVKGRTPYSTFKADVYELMKPEYGSNSIEKAVDIIGRREYFFDNPKERYVAQSYASIKEDQEFMRALGKAYHKHIPKGTPRQYLKPQLVDVDKQETEDEIFKLYYIDAQGRRVYSGVYYKQVYVGETHEFTWEIGIDNGQAY